MLLLSLYNVTETILAFLFVLLQDNFMSNIPFLLYINLESSVHVGILIAQGTEYNDPVHCPMEAVEDISLDCC